MRRRHEPEVKANAVPELERGRAGDDDVEAERRGERGDLGGLLGQLSTLLNQILAILNLGV